MPLILGANSVSGYTVKNSLRFNPSSSDTLSRTPSTTTDRQKWTMSFWLKRSGIASPQNTIFGQGSTSIANVDIFIGAGNRLGITFDNTAGGDFRVDMYLRDVSAWYNIIVACDTTQATASNRVITYINGVQQPYSTEVQPSQNYNTQMNTNTILVIGTESDVATNYLNGYLSEFYLIDGQQLTPSSFGETDEDTGIWKPKAYTGSFGTNGFYLDFEDSANLGNDMSGNNNDFTVNNLTSIDQSTDTPTNNFATFNPLYSSSGTGFTNGNLDYQNTVASWKSALSNIAVNKGKWYAEFKYILRDTANAEYGWVGICDVQQAETYSATWLGSAVSSGTGIAYGTQAGDIYGNNVSLATVSNPALNDIIGIAMDLDNNFVYFSLNGTFQNSGVPTSGSSGTGGFAISTAVTKFYVFGTSSYDSSKWSANFGSPAFTIASGNADANGYGNFEYAVPSGYYALCTKNLAQFG